MRVIKYMPILLLVSTFSIAILITFGIYTAERSFYVMAIWLVGLFCVAAGLAVVQGYKRIVTRQGTANERLGGLRLLQERRYEQLRGRLDYILDFLNSNIAQKQVTRSLVRPSSGIIDTLRGTDLHGLTSRLERSERRIMGRLEDELYAQDQNRIRLTELTTEIERLLDTLNEK